MSSLLPLRDVEDRAAPHVVVDHAVGETVEGVGLSHDVAAYSVDLGRRDPVGERLLLDANQFGREHGRGETDDWHRGGNAVVVGGIALRDGERLATALRRPD